jgi:hypothetical protein
MCVLGSLSKWNDSTSAAPLCGILVTNPPKPAADGSFPFPMCCRKWNAVLAFLVVSACVGVHTDHSSGQGSRLASTHVSITIEHASQHDPFGPSRLHNDHTSFVVDFLEFDFSTLRRYAGGGPKRSRRTHTSVPWSEIPEHPRL